MTDPRPRVTKRIGNAQQTSVVSRRQPDDRAGTFGTHVSPPGRERRPQKLQGTCGGDQIRSGLMSGGGGPWRRVASTTSSRSAAVRSTAADRARARAAPRRRKAELPDGGRERGSQLTGLLVGRAAVVGGVLVRTPCVRRPARQHSRRLLRPSLPSRRRSAAQRSRRSTGLRGGRRSFCARPIVHLTWPAVNRSYPNGRVTVFEENQPDPDGVLVA